MARIYTSGFLFVLGAIDLVWGCFTDKPIIPGISNWLQSKGYGVTMTHLILGLLFIILGLLVLQFSKPKIRLKIKPLSCQKIIGNKFECLVEVENENSNEPAENVEVKLLKIEPIPKHEPSKTPLPLTFPIYPQPKSNNPTVINPKDSERFLLFNVKQTFTEVEFEIVGLNHKLNTFTHGYFDFDPPFPKLKPPEVLEYLITLTVSAKGHALVRQVLKLECPAKWIKEKPFLLTEI